MKSSAMPSWMYNNPESICDGLIAQSKKQEAAEVKQFEMRLKQNRRRVRALTKLAKAGRLRGA